MRALAAAVLIALTTGCVDEPAESNGAAPPDTTPPAAASPPSGEWPTAGAPVDLSRRRSMELTGAGEPEIVTATARGPRYEALDIALTITTPAGDTLWHDAWTSLHYFKYDPLEGKADSALSRIVRGHVDSLLTDDRFTARGLPARLSQGAAVDDAMAEAVRYHLAELDWRSRADLTPADELPPDAHSRIDARLVAPERVAVVIRELRDRPTFWYYAGGEETYAIAWSDREHAFVRLHSCC